MNDTTIIKKYDENQFQFRRDSTQPAFILDFNFRSIHCRTPEGLWNGFASFCTRFAQIYAKINAYSLLMQIRHWRNSNALIFVYFYTST